jgi:type IV pilus assembly protein PilW
MGFRRAEERDTEFHDLHPRERAVRAAIHGPDARAARIRRARGFSLIELMVALTLGLIVTGAVIATFVSVHSASADTAGAAELADNGRIALDILQQTLRSAGYMACNSTLRQAVSTGLSPTPLTGDFTEALAGYEAAPGGSGTGPGSAVALAAQPPGDNSASDWATSSGLGNALDSSALSDASALPISGSDIIAVHTTYSQVTPVYTNAQSGANSVTVQSTTGLGAGELGIVSNCASSVVDEIQTVAGGTVTFDQPLGQTFRSGSQVAVADTIVFYVGTGSDGDGALYSYSLAGTASFQKPAEVVPDIENMQILYGVDTTGSLAATEYVTADQVPAAAAANPDCQPIPGTGAVDFNCVVSVKLALLVASPLHAVPPPKQAQTFNLLGTAVTAPIDTRMRRVFETTVSLRDTTH